MQLSDVAFLAADTARSRAYCQAMVSANIKLASVLIVKSPGEHRWGQQTSAVTRPELQGLFVPELDIQLSESAEMLCTSVQCIDTGTLNCPEVVEWIKRTSARLVIFSGYGGEIIKQEVLRAGACLLHMHGGWLPEYRGSTPCYYSYLQDKSFGVSSLLLDEHVDSGPIIARQRYPVPPPETDIDYYYDSVIRADLLISTLKRWSEQGDFEELIDQKPHEGTTYYVIHPVLKHIALNSLRGLDAKPRARPAVATP